jgi:D-arabinitol dehydrogenase (NADP+)
MSVASGPLPTNMPAARIEAPGRSAVTTVSRPRPGAGEVLIEVERAGICGTDIHILHGQYELARFPLTPGHEFSGTIVALGEGVRRRRVGERVTADPNIPCLTCTECQRNAFNQCHELQVLGVTRDGAFASYVVAPERLVFPIGELSFEAGALVEPLACVVWGLKRLRVQPGDRALVFGAGPMGCLLLQAVRAAGASHVSVVDLVPGRLEIALALGADRALTPADAKRLLESEPAGYELVADATGVPGVIEGALPHARPGGTIWVFGVAPHDARISISPYELFRRDLSLVGSFAVNKTFQEAISLIESGAVDLAPLVSHVLPLAEFDEGMRLARHAPERMKIQFAIGDRER